MSGSVHPKESGMMLVEDAFYQPASIGRASGTHSYKAGDYVLMLIGDTLLPAVIEGAYQPAGTSEGEWSVRSSRAGRVYQIPESFLRPYATSPT